MKKNIIFFVLFSALAFVAKAQNEIVLHLAPRLDSATFSLNTPFEHPNGSYQVKYTRLEYYVSDIKITHDGGQITPCPDLYLLVRPALDSMYSLGQMPGVQNVEAITFSVGVPEAVNHTDPSLFPANHPLAPQNPSMHWGWAAGYRFAAVEGVAGTNFSQTFEIHALGDENYQTQTISTIAEQVAPGMKVIHLVADYSEALSSIKVAGGLIEHGTTGAAVTLLNNFKNLVFTAETSTVIDPSFTGSFMVSPNPTAKDFAPQVHFSLPAGNDYELTVTDLTGKIVVRQPLTAAENQWVVLEKIPAAGLFFVHLWQNARPVAVEKLVVMN